jgi:hypothetical protein
MALSGPGGTWRRSDPDAYARPITGWAVWYADGSVWRSDLNEWADLHREGVQVIMLQHEGGRRAHLANCDEYAIEGEERTLLGLQIDFAKYEEISKAALTDLWRATP